MATFTSEINVSVDEFLDELDADERKELYESLKDEFENTERMDKERALEYLRALPRTISRNYLSTPFTSRPILTVRPWNVR